MSNVRKETLKGLMKGLLKDGDEKLMKYLDRCKNSAVVQKAEELAKQVLESPTTQKVKDEYEKISRKAIKECFRIFDEVGLGKDVEPTACNCTCGDCKAKKEVKKTKTPKAKTTKSTKATKKAKKNDSNRKS